MYPWQLISAFAILLLWSDDCLKLSTSPCVLPANQPLGVSPGCFGARHSSRTAASAGRLIFDFNQRLVPTGLDTASSERPQPQAIRLVHAINSLSDDNQFIDLAGKPYSFKASPDCKALVLIFATTDCPIANSYLPTLAKLHQSFQKRGFEFALVHEGPNQSANKLKNHAKEFEVPFSIVMDSEHSIAKRLNATKTPEAIVLDRDGQVLYQGRIDNLHQAFGKKRPVATREDLRLALEEIEAGKDVSTNKTEAVGCSIPLAVGR